MLALPAPPLTTSNTFLIMLIATQGKDLLNLTSPKRVRDDSNREHSSKKKKLFRVVLSQQRTEINVSVRSSKKKLNFESVKPHKRKLPDIEKFAAFDKVIFNTLCTLVCGVKVFLFVLS